MNTAKLPNLSALRQLMDYVRHVAYPGYFEPCPDDPSSKIDYVENRKKQIHALLLDQLSQNIADQFIAQIPDITALLQTDAEAMLQNDPAAHGMEEVILCYPTIQAMLHFRVAHALYALQVPIIPRMLTEMAHSQTGIDIHPGAQIGQYFAIDHGTGVVIGATCIIGNHVTLYQGVTLGAKNFHTDLEGHLIDEPRHPILEDYVTVYSNTSILGRIVIGQHSVIGGNVWLTHDVKPYSHIVQGKEREQ